MEEHGGGLVCVEDRGQHDLLMDWVKEKEKSQRLL